MGTLSEDLRRTTFRRRSGKTSRAEGQEEDQGKGGRTKFEATRVYRSEQQRDEPTIAKGVEESAGKWEQGAILAYANKSSEVYYG